MTRVFREVNNYRNVLDDVVGSAPDDLSTEELHAATWPIAAEHFAPAKRVRHPLLRLTRGRRASRISAIGQHR